MPYDAMRTVHTPLWLIRRFIFCCSAHHLSHQLTVNLVHPYKNDWPNHTNDTFQACSAIRYLPPLSGMLSTILMIARATDLGVRN